MTLQEWSQCGYPGRFVTDFYWLQLENGNIQFHPISQFGQIRASFSGTFGSVRELTRYLGNRASQVHGEVQQP